MRRKRLIWSFIFLIVAGGSYYAYKQYSRKNKDLSGVKPDMRLEAGQLIKEYESNDSASNQKYLGKILELHGNLRQIDKDENGYYTLILGDPGTLSSVRCSMDTNHQQDAAKLAVNSSTTVRGACTGFNKDDMGLGSDVILNRCVILNKKK